MDYKVVLAFALPIGLGIVALGSALALARAIVAAMEATSRQPEASFKILIGLVAGCAFIEALTIYMLVFVWNFIGKM